MRKIIYGIGSIFLVIGLGFALFILIGISSGGKDPYHLSPAEFENIYKNKESYSFIYFGNNNNMIFICLDESIIKEKGKKPPNCEGHRRYIKVDELKKERIDELLRSI